MVYVCFELKSRFHLGCRFQVEFVHLIIDIVYAVRILKSILPILESDLSLT